MNILDVNTNRVFRLEVETDPSDIVEGNDFFFWRLFLQTARRSPLPSAWKRALCLMCLLCGMVLKF